MKKLIIVLTFVFVITSINPTKVNAWGTDTHTNITRYAFDILEKEKPDIYSYIQNNLDISSIYRGSIDPDWEEVGAGTHYYVYPGRDNNVGQYYKNAFFSLSRDSARTRLERHYSDAKNDFKRGDISSASLHLGRALHYLQDICCTPHSAGIQYTLFGKNTHREYEEFCDGVSYNRKLISESASYAYHDTECYDLGFVLNNLCRSSSSYKEYVLSGEKDKYYQAFKGTFLMSQDYTASFINKFVKELFVVKEEKQVLPRDERRFGI